MNQQQLDKIDGVPIGSKLCEGKTKIVYSLPLEKCQTQSEGISENDQLCLIHSKDRITAGDGAKSHQLQGKAEISTSTMCHVFQYLNALKIGTHFVKRVGPTSFVARRCRMIPIEFVVRRLATGSFLKRNPGVLEGYRFLPPKLEYFYKDDLQHDPQWSREQVIASVGDLSGGKLTGSGWLECVDCISQAVFEVLERLWSSRDCQLVDMKMEYGLDCQTGEILLADSVDSDSWRLWPAGDRRLQLDKQLYRDMPENGETEQTLSLLLKNFSWVSDQLKELTCDGGGSCEGTVVIVMASASDRDHAESVATELGRLGLTRGREIIMRACSAHKCTAQVLDLVAEYEGRANPVVFIAIAGRSNGLGPVIAGNTCWPVINCPPITSSNWCTGGGREDVWSSLRMPSGISCATVCSANAAALHAASILSSSSGGPSTCRLWTRLRARRLLNILTCLREDAKLHSENTPKLE